jgi:hypothetical protein
MHGPMNVKIKVAMSLQHWWNDTDSEKLEHSVRNLPHCHVVHCQSHRDNGMRSNPGLCSDRWVNNCLFEAWHSFKLQSPQTLSSYIIKNTVNVKHKCLPVNAA